MNFSHMPCLTRQIWLSRIGFNNDLTASLLLNPFSHVQRLNTHFFSWGPSEFWRLIFHMSCLISSNENNVGRSQFMNCFNKVCLLQLSDLKIDIELIIKGWNPEFSHDKHAFLTNVTLRYNYSEIKGKSN